MYWHAKTKGGDIITLTEREALTHFEKNNISQRMQLHFIGTSSGKATKEAKEKIKELIASKRPENYGTLSKEDANVVDSDIRHQNQAEIKKILNEAMEEELKEAKENGVKQPRKDLRIHTQLSEQGGYSRDQVLGSMNGMI